MEATPAGSTHTRFRYRLDVKGVVHALAPGVGDDHKVEAELPRVVERLPRDRRRNQMMGGLPNKVGQIGRQFRLKLVLMR